MDCVKHGGRNEINGPVVENIQRFVPVSVRRVPQTWTIRCNTDWECIFWSTSSSSSISCRFASARSSRKDLTGRQRPFSSDSSLPGWPPLIYRPWARIEARNKCHPICCPVIDEPTWALFFAREDYRSGDFENNIRSHNTVFHSNKTVGDDERRILIIDR